MAKDLPSLLSTILPSEAAWKIKIFNHWHASMGHLADKVFIEKIEKDTLVLAVYDSCWMQELYLLSDLLLTTINQNLDAPYIKHLRFKKAGMHKKKKLRIPMIEKKEYASVALTTQEQQALSQLKDEHLADALKQFLIRCYQERE